MSEEYANIVFDELYRPSDRLEDVLGDIENKIAKGLDELTKSGKIEKNTKIDMAMLLALQACRYPERFSTLLDLGKYLAIALFDYRECPNVTVLNNALRAKGVLPGINFTSEDFERLRGSSEEKLAAELEAILALHGYEASFNPELIISSAQQVATHILGLKWTLVHCLDRNFILSDRPVPLPIGYGFDLGLTSEYGLRLSDPDDISQETLYPITVTSAEVDDTNAKVRARAKTWICGPGAWVHSL